MDNSKYDYIVLNLADIDIQFKVYKKILEINGKISQGTNSVNKDEPYWFYEIETNEFGKCTEEAINKESDLLCDTISDFFKKLNQKNFIKRKIFFHLERYIINFFGCLYFFILLLEIYLISEAEINYFFLPGLFILLVSFLGMIYSKKLTNLIIRQWKIY